MERASEGESEKSEIDEHLVGERVKEGTEVGGLVVFASKATIDEIGESGSDKADKSTDSCGGGVGE